MKIGFDARAWERPPHSFRRVLDLLAVAVEAAGWDAEFWVEGPLHEDCDPVGRQVRVLSAQERPVADVFWSPQMECAQATGPRVATLHDVNPLLPDGRDWLSRTYRAARFRRQVKQRVAGLDGLVTDSADSRDRIRAAFPRLRREPMVVPLFADAAYRPIDSDQVDLALQRHGLRSGYFLFVGSFRRHKNWDGLIRAYGGLSAKLRARHPLVMIGSTARAEVELGNLVASLGVEADVVTPGQVSDGELPAIYNGAIALVFPSFLEGFGLPPLEAMACGRAVISSNRTSLPEVLGEAPIYADPEDLAALRDAMQRVAEDAELRRDLEAAGVARAQLYSPLRTANAMADVIASLA